MSQLKVDTITDELGTGAPSFPVGNVGIGTTNPNTRLHVAQVGRPFTSTADKTNGDMTGIVITSNTNQNTMSGIWFSSGTDHSGTHWSGISGSRSNHLVDWSTQLTFYTHVPSTTNITQATEKMRITGDGIVTMPYQPAFQVRGTYSGGIGAGGKFTFTSALGGQSPEATFDRTGSWSDANSRYTAPVTGVYQFNFSVYTQGVQSVIQSLAPRVNGSQLLMGDNLIFFRSATGETGNTDNQVSGSFLLKLNANDYVELFVRLGAPSFTTYSGHSNFSGFLVG